MGRCPNCAAPGSSQSGYCSHQFQQCQTLACTDLDTVCAIRGYDSDDPLPVSMDMVVVFPAPLCPSRAVIWPLYMLRFKLSTAFLGNLFLQETRSNSRWNMDCMVWCACVCLRGVKITFGNGFVHFNLVEIRQLIYFCVHVCVHSVPVKACVCLHTCECVHVH